MNSLLFPIYQHKIKKKKTYKYVYSGKNRISTSNLLIFYRENNQNATYFGTVITRKVGNSVKRSRIKRVIVEALKRTGFNFPYGYSYVFVVKVQQTIAELQQLIEEQNMIAQKIRLRIQNNPVLKNVVI